MPAIQRKRLVKPSKQGVCQEAGRLPPRQLLASWPSSTFSSLAFLPRRTAAQRAGWGLHQEVNKFECWRTRKRQPQIVMELMMQKYVQTILHHQSDWLVYMVCASLGLLWHVPMCQDALQAIYTAPVNMTAAWFHILFVSITTCERSHWIRLDWVPRQCCWLLPDTLRAPHMTGSWPCLTCTLGEGWTGKLGWTHQVRCL